jgi:hypothetical protein
MTDAEWLLRGVALVEAALKPEPLLSPQGSFFALVSDLEGEMALSLVVAVLAVIARLGLELDQGAIEDVLNRVRGDALREMALE